MNEFKFETNKLTISEVEIEFDYDIGKVIRVDKILLVLLILPKGSKEVDNLYGVGENGEILWRIQSVDEALGITKNTPYVSLKVVNPRVAQVTSFFGMRFSVDIRNGEIIDKKCIGW